MVAASAFRQLPNSCNTVFNIAGRGRMGMIYCRCGRIVNMDSMIIKMKLSMGKNLECPKCRNERIFNDIDEINMHFEGIEPEDDF